MLKQLMQQGMVGPDAYVQRAEDGAPRPLRDFDPTTLKLLPQFLPPLPTPEPAPPPPPEWWSRKYFAFHWRGQLPPLFALGVNTWLPLPLLLVLMGMAHRVDLGAQGRWVAGLLVLLQLGLMSALGWAGVGGWRCLTRLSSDPDAPAATRPWKSYRPLLRASLALIAALALWLTLPPAWDWLRIAAGNDPQGRYATVIDPVSGALRVSGSIGYGVSGRVQSLLERNPSVRIIQLELSGGRVAEAQRLAALVQARKLVTFVEQQCSGPCTVVFAAGDRRVLAPAAQLAFHRYPDPRNPKRTLHSAQAADSSFLQAQGVLIAITVKMFDAEPATPWTPPQKLLLDARLAHLVVQGDELQLALNAPAQFELLHHPVMRVLKTHATERHTALAEALKNADTPQLEATVSATLLALETLVREHARTAPDAPLQEYVRSLIGLARAVQQDDPALCYRTLFGVGNEAALRTRISSFELYQHRQRAAAVVQGSFDTPTAQATPSGRGERVFRMALSKKIDEDADLMGTPRADTLTPERRCQAAILYFDNALRMPVEYRYDLLRSLL